MNILLLNKWVEIRKSLDIISNQVTSGDFPYVIGLQKQPWTHQNHSNGVLAVEAGCNELFSQKNPVSGHPGFHY
ncbi:MULTISPECIES: hypothetical protein [unclassified Microcoleus]|uniref:hypothetical protein n=1 Tax=unclassified Microcoleus TaxID=2642155 RepID=UPI002FD45E7F